MQLWGDSCAFIILRLYQHGIISKKKKEHPGLIYSLRLCKQIKILRQYSFTLFFR